MATLPELTDTAQAIPISIPVGFFVGSDKLILKFIWNCKETQNSLEKT